MRSLALLATLLVLPVPLLAPVHAGAGEPAWGPLSTAILRPGAELEGICTLDFLFYDAVGTAYVGTAAHCTDRINQRVDTNGLGKFGTVVFDSDVTPGAHRRLDFALIQIDADKVGRAHPQMLGHYGPTGVATRADLLPGDALGLYGHGQALGLLAPTRARHGVLVSATNFEYDANMASDFGDSGGPIVELATGLAVGIVSRLEVGVPPTTDTGPLVVWILQELSRAGFDVQLATVPPRA